MAIELPFQPNVHNFPLSTYPIFSSFLEGYQYVRPFTAEQKQTFPYLYALITAFWGVDMKWADSSRTKTVDEADDFTVHQWMKEISEREATVLTVPG